MLLFERGGIKSSWVQCDLNALSWRCLAVMIAVGSHTHERKKDALACQGVRGM